MTTREPCYLVHDSTFDPERAAEWLLELALDGHHLDLEIEWVTRRRSELATDT